MSANTIRPEELFELHRQGRPIELIDVRSPAEFRECHVEFARNVPLHELDPAAIVSARNGNGEPLYVICRSGGRASQACERFVKAGYANAVNVEGGTLACEQAGLPVVRGKKMISLERQARIGAGIVVLTGLTLGLLVHPAFLGLSAFVGCMLIFAGVTDICAMGLLLARMPWNQGSDAPQACAMR